MIKMKKCTRCKLFKKLKEFSKNKSRKDGLRNWCKDCRKSFREENKEKISEQKKIYHRKYPWKRILCSIKQRCNNLKCKSYKDYGERGIKCLITEIEIKQLWFRDKAYLMKKPSIDRINNNGNYCLENCRFIEFSENSTERNIRISSKVVYQYDLNGNFIKDWKSVTSASKQLKISKEAISICARKITKSSGGFVWIYK